LDKEDNKRLKQRKRMNTARNTKLMEERKPLSPSEFIWGRRREVRKEENKR